MKLTEMQKQERATMLAATPADQRSETAARFDHQAEADWLASAEPTEWERHEALLDLNAGAVCDFVENCGYRAEQIYARLHSGMLPGHLRASLNFIQGQPQPQEAVTEAVSKRRANRLRYLRLRYGVAPQQEIAHRDKTGTKQ